VPDSIGAPTSVAVKSHDQVPCGGYWSYTDAEDVVHGFRCVTDGDGPWTSVQYEEDGVRVIDLDASWSEVNGGWILDASSMTVHVGAGAQVIMALSTGDVSFASRSLRVPSFDQLAQGAKWLLLPRPLAAQHYIECGTQWGQWIAAVGAVVYWADRALVTRSFWDIMKAVAAFGAAELALNRLVDCIAEQPQNPDPN